MERTSSAELFVPALCSIISLPILYVQRGRLNDYSRGGADQSEGPEVASNVRRGRREEMDSRAVAFRCRVLQCICILVLALTSIAQTATCWTSKVGLKSNHWDVEFCPERFFSIGYVRSPSNLSSQKLKYLGLCRFSFCYLFSKGIQSSL